jgi:hypothetical protein
MNGVAGDDNAVLLGSDSYADRLNAGDMVGLDARAESVT